MSAKEVGKGAGCVRFGLERLRTSEIDTIAAAFPDHCGRLLGKRLPIQRFLEVTDQGESLHACNYLLTVDMEMDPLPGFALASWDRGYGDFALRPDLTSLRPTPWLPASALVLCDLLHEDGRPVEESPRRILKRQVQACEAEGLAPQAASELEFYLFRGTYEDLADRGFRGLVPTTPYLIDYDILGTSRDEDFLRAVRSAMIEALIPIEGSKGEWGRGQHEVNLAYCEAVEMADRHVVFKEGVKLLATRHGVAATFMAKVHHEMAGSSCHLHLSLRDGEERNAFWDESKGEPSPLFRSFLAGCMDHAREMTLFFAPTVNSYKRYRAATFAPVAVAWGEDNRTCGFRVIGHGQSLRIENRIPGADVNPYLAFAAMLAAGRDGVRRGLELGPPTVGNAYAVPGGARVPTSLAEATDALAGSAFAREALGEAVATHYLRLAELERANFEGKVTDWETARYFERV